MENFMIINNREYKSKGIQYTIRSACLNDDLARFIHKVEFGVGVLKEYWGYGIGRSLLCESISWADANGI